ncbi:Surfeit locus protein 6 [Abeliophyllum distichum]|uniref:Surfeit locus protein 6 n=1 Tax=Abeliophyllum distichum TaxID=126358 RepID=A0ABD1QLK2_9LAMI
MGVKVHDDARMIKESMKKEKNAQKWKERVETQEKMKKEKQQKRKDKYHGEDYGEEDEEDCQASGVTAPVTGDNCLDSDNKTDPATPAPTSEPPSWGKPSTLITIHEHQILVVM